MKVVVVNLITAPSPKTVQAVGIYSDVVIVVGEELLVATCSSS